MWVNDFLAIVLQAHALGCLLIALDSARPVEVAQLEAMEMLCQTRV